MEAILADIASISKTLTAQDKSISVCVNTVSTLTPVVSLSLPNAIRDTTPDKQNKGKETKTKGGSMPLKDLSGKTVYDLEREDFEKLYCQHCKDYGICDRDDSDIGVCKAVVDSGIFDHYYRIRQAKKNK